MQFLFSSRMLSPDYTNSETIASNLQRLAGESLIRELFTSSPTQTGGVEIFPYARIDTALLIVQERIALAQSAQTLDEEQEDYRIAARYALILLLWIEVGFNGIENYARSSPFTVNWTDGPGHSATS